MRNILHTGCLEDRGDALPSRSRWTTVREVVKQSQGVRLAASELGGKVVNRRSLKLDTGKTSDHAGGKLRKILREKRPLKETPRLLVVGRSSVIPNVVQVDGKFRCVKRTIVSQVLARSYNLVPGFQC